uniref:Alpha/beta hydrolase fold-3 domain-containing protein n=1 Tax=Moniliophthora roreri TaxID=221103 RepID=A0A0W0F0A8_MONRR
MAEYSHLSNIDLELAPLVANAPPWVKTSADTIREGFEKLGIPIFKQNSEPFLPPPAEYQVIDRDIDVGESTKVLARCVTPVPREGEDSFPLLFWMHGGGWTIGNVEMDDNTMRTTSVELRMSVVNCEYRLAPENPFPAAVNDTFAALKYVASHPEEFSASLKKGFIVAGASAGGNLSAVLSHLARDDPFFKDKPITGQHLQVPLVCHPAAYPEKYKSSLLSMEQNKDAPGLSKAATMDFLGWYNAPPEDLRISPLLLPSHKELPPAFIQVCGFDPLRDEGILYERVLKEAGVLTRLEVYPGTTHGFHLQYASIKQGAKWREDCKEGLRWLLQRNDNA